jgi:predicted GIY-YIG superfamily endonuclease
MQYPVYILRFSDNNLYIGQTNDLEARFKQHLNKTSKSAKFAKEREDFELAYRENYNSRIEAMHREKQLKGWTRSKKEALIAGNKALLKKL